MRYKLAALVVALVGTLVLSAVPASALMAGGGSSERPTIGTTVHRTPGAGQHYLDYIDRPDVKTVGKAQCTKALRDRTGPWMCLGAPPDAPVQHRVFCNIEGCWNVADSTHASWEGGGYYGYGATTLGNVDLYFKVTISGFNTYSYPVRFKSTRGVRNLFIEGERLYISSTYPGGNGVSNGASWAHIGPYSVSAGSTKSWASPGYKSRETTARTISIVHMWTWSDPSSSYPGKWWVYTKSNKAYWHDVGYRFIDDDDNYPYDASNAGYEP